MHGWYVEALTCAMLHRLESRVPLDQKKKKKESRIPQLSLESP